jgi:hypothetical protein
MLRIIGYAILGAATIVAGVYALVLFMATYGVH